MPVVGVLGATSPDLNADFLRAFREALKDTGFVESENVAIVYLWAEHQIDRLPGLAAELTRRRVAALATIGNAATLASKAATTTTPIVFQVGDDPVRLGLVGSLARPGGNLTGVNFFAGELAAKRLELLHELVPSATRVAMLINPGNPNAEAVLRDVQAGARAMGLQIQVHNAATTGEIDAAFATFVRERPDAPFVSPDPFFRARRVQLALLAAYHRLPATYALRDYAEAGGLMSYEQASTMLSARSAPMSAASSKARSLRICRWCGRPSSSWSSTPRQPGCLVSPCRPSCSPAPTR